MSLAGQAHQDHASSNDRFAQPWLRFAILTIYYLGILVALFALYGQGNFSTPPFIYQNF
jgi:hypothetical protein